jgi:pimeloyl-ACP methyl ester carboxylesterase
MSNTSWDVVERGSGSRTLVLIPGAMGTATSFEAILDPLGEHIRVLAVSPPAEPDAGKLADGLLGLLDERAIERIDLLGTSFGGYVAQFFAAKYPTRLGTLLLANTFADPALTRRRPLDEVLAEPAAVIVANTQKFISSTPPSATREAILAQLAIMPAEALKARQVGLSMGATAPQVDTKRVHLVLIDTADDPVITPPARDDLVARYSGCSRITLAAGGHFPYVANVDAYVAAVRQAVGGVV